jgi:molybdenum cofactor biosynthesis protein B
MSSAEHRIRATTEGPATIRCGILTISDTRTVDTDTSGATLREMLTHAGHDVVRYELVPDEPASIAALFNGFITTGCHVIISNGGTGIARRDSTFEVIDKLFEKRIPGFGELFRTISYADIGAAAMLSRATAGVYRDTIIFCLPGSTSAVQLALEKLILPELAHIVWEIVRQ